MSFNIGVVGTGYVGIVSGTSFAATGNNVLCVDIDKEKVEKMKEGISPIYEPGLEHLMQQNINQKRLNFTTDLNEAINHADIMFLCLPTPPGEGGAADLQYVLKVANDIADYIKSNNITDRKIIVNKSTVPVGTAEKVKSIFTSKLGENNNLEVVSNPEFLREGFAVEDAMKPERVVIGTSADWVVEKMDKLYKPFLRSGNPIHFMDEKSAEVTKYAANSFLAVKISFMNDLARYTEAVGADIDLIRKGIGSDTRIGKRFLFPGIGYGGSCFPKDVQALDYSADEAGTPLRIIKAAGEVNKSQILFFFDKIMKRYNYNLKGKKFALWGLAFKPNTDDTREAPAFVLIEKLLEAGATINTFDPEAMKNTKEIFGDRINFTDDMYSCLVGADSLLIATEWNEFRTPEFDKLKEELSENLIFDGRNLWEPNEMKELGFEYHCIGR